MKALLWSAILLLPAAGQADDSAPGDGDVAALIEDCLGHKDLGELTAAVQQQVGNLVVQPSFSRQLQDVPNPASDLPHREMLLMALGHHLMVNAGQPGGGLPPVGRFSKPYRLGPLFDGMLPDRFEKDPSGMLQPLLPLVTPEWLDTAAVCGAYDFIHSVRLLRGEINDLLRAYEQAENQSGLLRLGCVLGRYPGISAQVKPADVSTATLAWLLSGAFSDSYFQGKPAATLAIACGEWSARHPGLCEELERITPRISAVAICQIARCLLREERDEAARRIAGINDYYQESARQLQYALLSRSDPAAPEIAADARAMSSKQLLGVLYEMLDINKHDDRELARALPLMRELLNRRDLPGGPPSLRHPAHSREAALRWWRAGQGDQAFDLLRLCFLTNRANESDDELVRVAKLARLFGKEAALTADVDRLAAEWGDKRFRFHRQAMREAAGQLPVSADERFGTPDWIAQGRIILEAP